MGIPLYFTYSEFNKNNIKLFSLPFFGKKETQKHDLYYWGNGKDLLNDKKEFSYTNYFPKKISNLTNDDSLKLIKLGQNFDIGINTKNELLTWDKIAINSSNNEKELEAKNIKRYKLPSNNIKSICITTSKIYLLDKNGYVYKYDIIINKHLDNKYTYIKDLKNIKSIRNNKDTLIALSNKGEIFTLGNNSLGECGVNNLGINQNGPFSYNYLNTVNKLNIPEKIIKITSGYYHNFALSEGNNVYGWGSNNYSQIDDILTNNEIPNLSYLNPTKINIFSDDNNYNFYNIYASSIFSFFFFKNNNEFEAYSRGFNYYGELATGFSNDTSKLEKAVTISNKNNNNEPIKIDKIKCGKNHCLALLSPGILLTWGGNYKGQLGNKSISSSSVPLNIKAFNKQNIHKFEVGDYDTAILTKTNN